MKTTLLASAPTKEDIEDCIKRFYCGEAKRLVPTANLNEWTLASENGEAVKQARVIKKRGRFRFEMIND